MPVVNDTNSHFEPKRVDTYYGVPITKTRDTNCRRYKSLPLDCGDSIAGNRLDII